MNKYFKNISLILILMSLLVACSPTSSNDDLQKLTLVLDWAPNTNHTGLFVAKNKGFFKEKGLEVEIVQPPEDGAEPLVASGKAEFGISFQDTIAPAFAKDNPLPVTAIAAVLQHNTSGIVSLAEDNINSPKDLEGKRYATWENPVEQAIIKTIVEEDGGDFDKLELIPSSVQDIAVALKTDIDAVWVFEGWDKIALDLKEIDTNYFAFKDIFPIFDYYTPIIIGNNDFINKNEKITKDFLEAIEKGYEYAIENPEDSAKILLEEFPELDDLLIIESQKFLAEEYKANEDKWGIINEDRWNNFYDWLFENKLIEQSIPNNFGFTNKFLTK